MNKAADADIFSFAPMEGITNHVFRNAHHAVFPGTDRYYTPFLGLNQNFNLQKKEWKDIDPGNQAAADGGAEVVVQVLTARADQFLWAAKELADRGYEEINLNTGCPAPTVVTRHKGAGLLEKRTELERLLDGIFEGIGKISTRSGRPMRVSVKTRTGMHCHEEAEALMKVFGQYPLEELIIHPRVRDEYYQGEAHPDVFARCVSAYVKEDRLCSSDAPVRVSASECERKICYNGDIYEVKDWKSRKEEMPEIRRWMLGRGFVTNPALVRQIRGGEELKAEELMEFHDRILDGYLQMGTEERNAMFRLFELWSYWKYDFRESEKYLKKIKKAKNLADYRTRVAELFAGCEFAPGRYAGIR